MNKISVRCPHCNHQIEMEYVFGKVNPYEIACPKDGWQMKPLSKSVGLHLEKSSVSLLSSAMRLLLAQKACEDVDRGKQILSALNRALGAFEEDSIFVKPERDIESFYV